MFEGLTAITVLMVLIQLTLLRRYRALPFSLGFWSFTFPLASVAALAITWLHLGKPAGWEVMTIGVLAIVTTAVGLVAAKSITMFFRLAATARRQRMREGSGEPVRM